MTRFHSVRRRDLILLVLTTAAAFGYFFAGQFLADHVGTMNSARLVGALMTARMSDPAPMTGRGTIGQLFGQRPPDRNGPTPEQRAEAERLKIQISTVEVVVHVWRRIMWGLAGALGLAALLAAVSARPRRWQLLAAAAILLSTAATAAGIWFLVGPEWGGMPPLLWRTYAFVLAAQALYGIILIVFYVRPQRVGAEPERTKSLDQISARG